MVWTYHEVRELRKKKNRGENISVSEIRSLEKYISIKKDVPAHAPWSKKQLLRAEELLQEIKKERKEKIRVS